MRAEAKSATASGMSNAAAVQPRRLMIAPAADGCNRLLGGWSGDSLVP
jgi:hypothetical protein